MKKNTASHYGFFLKKTGYWQYVLFSIWLCYPIYKSITALSGKPSFFSFPSWVYYTLVGLFAIFLIFSIQLIIHRLSKKEYWSGYPLFFISAFLSIFPLSFGFLKINIAVGIFLLFILILSKYHKNKNAIPLFYAGIFVGVITLIIPLGVLFFFLIFTILIDNQDFYWKKWMATIIGFSVPFIYLLSFFYLLDSEVSMLSFFSNYQTDQGKIIWKDWVWIGFFSSFLILTFFLRNIKNHEYNIFERTPIICFHFIGLVSLLLATLLYREIEEIFLFFGVSFSLLFSYYFDKKWIPEKEKNRVLLAFIISGVILWVILFQF